MLFKVSSAAAWASGSAAGSLKADGSVGGGWLTSSSDPANTLASPRLSSSAVMADNLNTWVDVAVEFFITVCPVLYRLASIATFSEWRYAL